jgi:hypothetical protein
MFIFNLNVVFTTDFLKMAPIHVRFSPGFLQEQDFMERNLRQRGSKQLRKKMRHVGSADQANCTHRTCILPVKLSSLRGAIEVRRSIPLREILLLRTR